MITTIIATAFLMSATAMPIPIILDTDLGDDIDDTWALAMLLGSPQVDVKLIVTASDDTPAKTRLAAKILERMGRTDIPLAQGVKTSDNGINQSQWLGDYRLANYKGKVIDDGVGALIETIEKSPVPIILCVIGPQTNIRAALDRDPAIARNARVVLMAGSVHVGYDGKAGHSPEWNVRKDVAAARAVFAAPWQITMAPLDICGTLRLSGPRYLSIKNSNNPRAVTVTENYDQWTNRKHYPADASSILFDTAAAGLTFDENPMEIETVKLSIDDEGNTVIDASGRPVRCALRWKDRDGFENLLVESIAGTTVKAK